MLSLLLLLACKDDLPPDDTSPGVFTYDEVQAVFDRSCATYGCHGGPEAETGLDLSPGASYAMLVGAPSAQLPSMARVSAGDAAGSYLIRKLEATQLDAGGSGDAMPPDLPFGLDAAEIASLRAWIDAGAAP